jgi:hypothetical protein
MTKHAVLTRKERNAKVTELLRDIRREDRMFYQEVDGSKKGMTLLVLNPKRLKLIRDLRTLVVITYCQCKQRLDIWAKWCPSCGAENVKVDKHENCGWWDPSLPYCGDCGKPSIPEDPDPTPQ